MGRYRPGSLDVFASTARGASRRQRIANEANLPSGSQPYQTTSKVRQGKDDIDRLDIRVAAVEAVVTAKPITDTWATSDEYYGRIEVTGLGRRIRIDCDRHKTAGAMIPGRTDTEIFVLPARYRPAYAHRLLLPWAGASTACATVSIATDGTVSVTTDTSVPTLPGNLCFEYPLD